MELATFELTSIFFYFILLIYLSIFLLLLLFYMRKKRDSFMHSILLGVKTNALILIITTKIFLNKIIKINNFEKVPAKGIRD